MQAYNLRSGFRRHPRAILDYRAVFVPVIVLSTLSRGHNSRSIVVHKHRLWHFVSPLLFYNILQGFELFDCLQPSSGGLHLVASCY